MKSEKLGKTSESLVSRTRGRGRPVMSAGTLGETNSSTQVGDVIAVNIDGYIITWSDGQWAGDRELIIEAKCKSNAKVMIPLTYLGKRVRADENDLLGALASMIAINPGRAKILSVPPSVNPYLVSSTLNVDYNVNNATTVIQEESI